MTAEKNIPKESKGETQNPQQPNPENADMENAASSESSMSISTRSPMPEEASGAVAVVNPRPEAPTPAAAAAEVSAPTGTNSSDSGVDPPAVGNVQRKQLNLEKSCEPSKRKLSELDAGSSLVDKNCSKSKARRISELKVTSEAKIDDKPGQSSKVFTSPMKGLLGCAISPREIRARAEAEPMDGVEDSPAGEGNQIPMPIESQTGDQAGAAETPRVSASARLPASAAAMPAQSNSRNDTQTECPKDLNGKNPIPAGTDDSSVSMETEGEEQTRCGASIGLASAIALSQARQQAEPRTEEDLVRPPGPPVTPVPGEDSELFDGRSTPSIRSDLAEPALSTVDSEASLFPPPSNSGEEDADIDECESTSSGTNSAGM